MLTKTFIIHLLRGNLEGTVQYSGYPSMQTLYDAIRNKSRLVVDIFFVMVHSIEV